jgi:hypothetical protein
MSGLNLPPAPDTSGPERPEKDLLVPGISETTRRETRRVGLLLIAGVGACLIVVAVVWLFLAQMMPGSSLSRAPTARARFTTTADARATSAAIVQRTEEAQAARTALIRPTMRAAEATATARSEGGRTWRAAIDDPFDVNGNDWLVGSTESEYWRGRRTIASGVYRWDVEEAYQDFVSWVYPGGARSTRFIVAVDARLASGPHDASFGVLIREASGSYYVFEVNDYYQVYSFSRNDNGSWETLIDWTYSPEILPGEWNRLAVTGEDAYFALRINDEEVDAVYDDQIRYGNMGLFISLTRRGDEAVFEFDNFIFCHP